MEGKDSEAAKVFDTTNEIIRKITRYAAGISEMSNAGANRRKEYHKVAVMFSKCKDIFEAHRLAADVFGIEKLLHLKGLPGRQTESINSGAFEEEPHIVNITSRVRTYKENPEELRNILTYVTAGIAKLKGVQDKKQKELLPVFSVNFIENPYYFDEGKTGEKLLFNYLRERNFNLKQEGLSRVEYKNRIYYEAGILKDEVSNDALAYGIHGWKPEGSISGKYDRSVGEGKEQ